MKPQACSNLQTLELLFQGKNCAQETKKKRQRNKETSIDLSRLQEMFNVSISRNFFQGSNNCSHIAVTQFSNFRDIICYIHNTNKQAKMNIENDDED